MARGAAWHATSDLRAKERGGEASSLVFFCSVMQPEPPHALPPEFTLAERHSSRDPAGFPARLRE